MTRNAIYIINRRRSMKGDFIMELTLGMYQSFGNDYLIYDCMKNEYELKPEDIRNICNRQFGAGSDGILVGPMQIYGKMGMKIYNPDGSEAAISGNGIFIFAKYLKDAGYVMKKEFTLQTTSRPVTIHYHNEEATEITISMGKLYLGQTEPVKRKAPGNYAVGTDGSVAGAETGAGTGIRGA